MRTRDEIENEDWIDRDDDWVNVNGNSITIELLLDIRDLLIEQGKIEINGVPSPQAESK